MPHTTDFQAEKALVRAFYADLDEADKNDVVTVLERYLSDDCLWRGMHPFHVQEGPKAVADSFWNPFKAALPRIQRRQDIFLAGRNSLGTDDSVWVVSMGHLAGLFDQPWLSIPSTRKLTFLPYCEFNKVFRGKIVETAMFCDIISVMIQAGLTPLPTQTGAFLLQPGPQTHDGLMFDRQPREAGEKTLALINSMIGDLTRENVYSPIDELRRSWKEDMNWFGPAGIGATFSLERYEDQHQRPFRDGLTNMVFNGHICRLAEGAFGGFFGWANLSMTASGGFMGLPACERPTEMRVIDMYRREGDLLAENWIFIDLLHFLNLQGLDVLSRLSKDLATR